ncbi:AarF/UbiB family protein [Cryobacterium sp. CG_9.6]|uniref:ABC1 kinase family protein n=1 Tax=Cryobacterium sp. CG_9.6 TaxID=2760710 RepID=UPI002474E8D9|nr:AarF/UbiB family protein [Cryobacterium sp. CG_9.6]MDH6237800.1 ubiquinone biosynthesis protein [Cryobacterium sp. CG_9.6]
MANETLGISVPRLSSFTNQGSADRTVSVLGRGRRFAQLMGIAKKNGLFPLRKLDFGSAPSGAATRLVQAEGLRRALEEAGGAFVKIGQLMSTRTDVLPEEFVSALSQLQHSVEPAPWDDVEPLLVTEFGAPLESLFSSFDREPVAAASIGQVHRATLKSGQVVAVKVQRPGIVPEVKRDVDIALRMVNVLSLSSPQARALGIRPAAAQYGADLIRQLDFRLEARNLLALRALQARGPHAEEIRLPELIESLSTDRVILMEFLEGDTFAALNERADAAPAALTAAMRVILSAFVRQIVFDGVYHADLHPGNIMLLANGQPALVDFGSVGRLDLQLRESVQELLIAFLQSDTQLIADGLLQLAPLTAGSDERGFRRDLSAFITLELGPGARIDVTTVDSMVAILVQYSMAIPTEFIAAARALVILEGTLRSTLPDFDLLEEARGLAAGQIRDQMAPANLREVGTTELLALLPSIRRLPRRFDQIGLALETGKLGVNVRLLAHPDDRRLLAGFIRQIGVGVVGLVSGILALGYLTAPLQASASVGLISTASAGVALGSTSIVLLAAALVDALVSRHRD